MSGPASIAHGLKRAYPFLVAAALVALYSQLQDSRDQLAKVQGSVAQLETLNAQLTERVARVSFQRLEPQASPFGTGPVSVAEKSIEPTQRMTPLERKEAIIEEQRSADRARFEQSQERAEQRQAGVAVAPGAPNDAPRQGPLAELMAKARRAP